MVWSKHKPVRGLGSDEADELGDTLLNALLRILGDLAAFGNDGLHDSHDVRDRKKPIG